MHINMRSRVNSERTRNMACWGNVVAMKYLCHKSAQILSASKLHDFFVTDYESSGDDREEFETRCEDIYRDYEADVIKTAKSVFKMLLEEWMYGYKNIYTKSHYRPLLLRILELVKQDKPLNFLLPGFPAKCRNSAKILGVHADFAEYLALSTLIETARRIQAVYPHGVAITILADPQTLDECEEVPQEEYDIYYQDMKEIIANMAADDVIKLLSIEAAQEFSSNKCDYIRVSVHHHHPKTEKFPVDLYKKYNCNNSVLRTPWRHVIIFDTIKGEFVIDHKSRLLDTTSDRSPVVTVRYKDYDWLLLKLSYSEENCCNSMLPGENDIEVRMIKNGTGIIVENKSGNKQLKSSIFHPECLSNLIKEFGVVILRGFERFQDEDDVTEFYSSQGSLGLVQWKLGRSRRKSGKAENGLIEQSGYISDNSPQSGYISGNSSQIHWELMAPPGYMDISQSTYKYEEHTCREMMLYCPSDLSSSSVTTFIDAHAAALALPGDLKQKWKNTVLTYHNKTHPHNTNGQCLRGQTYDYPLIQRCPWTDKDVLRCAGINTDNELDSTNQKQTYTIKSGWDSSPRELDEDIQRQVVDDRFAFKHKHCEGDQVFVNNYTMLQSTKGLENGSQLWRLHLVPPSDNIPDYFQNI